MTGKKTAEDLLEGAYRIRTPDDSRAYYAEFAESYDQTFAQGLGYSYPRALADAWRRHAREGDIPLADIGCGTGLVAEALALPPERIEGFDISPEMLEKARAKGLYATLHCTDLTQPLPPDPRFGSIVSAGTFTHGHLGPEALENLLALARPGALFVIGINAAHYAERGFEAQLEALAAAGAIGAPVLERTRIYAREDGPHGRDEAVLAIFRTAGA